MPAEESGEQRALGAQGLGLILDDATWKAIRVAFLLSFGAVVFGLLVTSHFSFDSWSIYELSPTRGRSFFSVATTRSYAAGQSEFSTAFAPLWPVLVTPFLFAFGNIYGLYAAAVVCFAAFAMAAEHLSSRALHQRGIGLLSALLFLRFTGIREEIGAGRSIPLFLVELACAGILLVQVRGASLRRAFTIGVLAGAMAMTRFDAMPASVVLILGAIALGVRDRRLIAMAGGLLLTILPWIVYSWAHFHRAFATDNWGVTLSIDPRAFVLDYHARPAVTAFDDPMSWLLKIVENSRRAVAGLVSAMLSSVFVPVIMAACLLTTARRAKVNGDSDDGSMLVFMFVAIAPLSGYIVTGYSDQQRFFSGMVWVATFLGLAFLSRRVSNFRGIALMAALVGTLMNLAILRYSIRESPAAHVHGEVDRTRIDSLASCLTRSGATMRDPVLFRDGTISAAKFGALTRWTSQTLPSNWAVLSSGDQRAFLTQHRARFEVGNIPANEPALGGATVPNCPVPVHRA